jgi:hypothetical protein
MGSGMILKNFPYPAGFLLTAKPKVKRKASYGARYGAAGAAPGLVQRGEDRAQPGVDRSVEYRHRDVLPVVQRVVVDQLQSSASFISDPAREHLIERLRPRGMPDPVLIRASSTTAGMHQAWPTRTVRSRSHARQHHSPLL